ncbi:hypothetical protein K435DRAFT_808471 [Dendrothele bispora CBS 962.96]|uniref:Uncharacterized protein n=1 Tax=Dendrothele bispora (strain CBS 962.96) TaxID=1314807 RepID=A0A4S8L1R0_DENBC|nr:hypothetical protein K435DRAFT_808471 [Dendrothele bispora CBS 962.96]
MRREKEKDACVLCVDKRKWKKQWEEKSKIEQRYNEWIGKHYRPKKRKQKRRKRNREIRKRKQKQNTNVKTKESKESDRKKTQFKREKAHKSNTACIKTGKAQVEKNRKAKNNMCTLGEVAYSALLDRALDIDIENHAVVEGTSVGGSAAAVDSGSGEPLDPRRVGKMVDFSSPSMDEVYVKVIGERERRREGNGQLGIQPNDLDGNRDKEGK